MKKYGVQNGADRLFAGGERTEHLEQPDASVCSEIQLHISIYFGVVAS